MASVTQIQKHRVYEPPEVSECEKSSVKNLNAFFIMSELCFRGFCLQKLNTRDVLACVFLGSSDKEYSRSQKVGT